jgi:hypothetical protein
MPIKRRAKRFRKGSKKILKQRGQESIQALGYLAEVFSCRSIDAINFCNGGLDQESNERILRDTDTCDNSKLYTENEKKNSCQGIEKKIRATGRQDGVK